MAWRLISAEANSDCSVLLRMRESLLVMLKKKHSCLLNSKSYSIQIMLQKYVTCVKYLSMMVRSLRYMVLSGWTDVGRRLCVRLRPGCASWEEDREARTLAAAEAAVLGGMKRWSRPCSPDAVRMGWARTLANRLSGWKQQTSNTEPISTKNYSGIEKNNIDTKILHGKYLVKKYPVVISINCSYFCSC